MRAARVAVAMVLAAVLVACSGGADTPAPYPTAKIGESQAILGWNVSLSNLRFDADYVLVDIDAAPAKAGSPHAKPESLRLGLYGALAHPLEANAIGSCAGVPSLRFTPATAPNPDKVSGTVCLGPMRDHSQVRGAYLYSPADRIAGSTVAYPAAYPVGLAPTAESDTGLVVRTSSVDGFRADGGQLIPQALGDPSAFTGKGYMLLGLEIAGQSKRYRDDAVKRGGPLMILASPTVPPPGVSRACDVYGSSLLVMPDTSLDAISVRASLCTQGDINAALLYATVAVAGTHAALWVSA
ncbi:hypothetical protein ABIA30_003017 [Mycobacterium sp. MAA66]|uniref:hypothetical protein n=1 Tax=Mycobacterium sp. MAA66 TaxID=3156297 RepID=UPI0035138833